MGIAYHLNRFGKYLHRDRRKQRPEKIKPRPRLEQLEDRMVLSTLFVELNGAAHYIANNGVNNNVALSERRLIIDPPKGSELPIPFLTENLLTDTAEKITVTGPGASRWSGSGTNSVSTLLPIPSLLVDVQDGNDVVNVQAINYVAKVQHNGPGSDTVNVGNAADGVQSITGPLTITAGFNNATTVNVDDSADKLSHPNVTLSNSAILNLAPAAINYQQSFAGSLHVNVTGGSTVGSGKDVYTITDTPHNGPFGTGSMTLNTESGVNQVNVQGTSGPLAIQGHGGTDTVTVGSLAPALGGTLANVHGAVSVSNTTNSTSLIVDDSGDPVARSVTISFDSVVFAGIGAPINYFAGVKSVDIFGSKGGDVFNFLPQFSTTPINVHGGAGVNTLVSVTGINNWTITGTNAGTLDNVAFQNVQNLRGGPSSLVDTFHFFNGGSVDGIIAETGFGSTATLDYSAVNTPVIVNLKTHVASGVHGGVLPGVFNIRNVTGGFGTNIIVGDGNNNVLKGGVGRSILISGGGNSTLQAGFGEAVLVGGHYVFDTNPNALAHLMAEWSHTYDPINPLHDYQIRVTHLEFGGGLNDPFLLNASTVFPDPGTQTLTTGAQFDFVLFDSSDVLTHPPRVVNGVKEVFLLV
jgi:hypothetical protein